MELPSVAALGLDTMVMTEFGIAVAHALRDEERCAGEAVLRRRPRFR